MIVVPHTAAPQAGPLPPSPPITVHVHITITLRMTIQTSMQTYFLKFMVVMSTFTLKFKKIRSFTAIHDIINQNLSCLQSSFYRLMALAKLLYGEGKAIYPLTVTNFFFRHN